MRQILLSGGQALVARVPRPSAAAGHVLVRVRYSLVSTGTETAALRPLTAGAAGTTAGEQVVDLSSRAQAYLGKALRDPRRAASRARGLLSAAVRQRLYQVKLAPPPSPIQLGQVTWHATGCGKVRQNGRGTVLDTDDSDSSYQAV